MKSQAPFSSKDKYKNKCRLPQLLLGAPRVNYFMFPEPSWSKPSDSRGEILFAVRLLLRVCLICNMQTRLQHYNTPLQVLYIAAQKGSTQESKTYLHFFFLFLNHYFVKYAVF